MAQGEFFAVLDPNGRERHHARLADTRSASSLHLGPRPRAVSRWELVPSAKASGTSEALL